MYLKKELKLIDLDGKVQNCFTPVGIGPFVAFGGVDGVVRIFDTQSWSVSQRLNTTGGHKSVQHLLSLIVIIFLYFQTNQYIYTYL